MPLFRFHSGNHTTTLVPIFAKGTGADVLLRLVRGQDPVYGAHVDNTDIFGIMNAAITRKMPTESRSVEPSTSNQSRSNK
jgi:alkaline phosphatase